MTASVTYAIKLYLELVAKGSTPREAYATAVELSGVNTAAQRAELRNAIASVK